MSTGERLEHHAVPVWLASADVARSLTRARPAAIISSHL